MVSAPFSKLLSVNQFKANPAIEYLGSATSHFQAEPLMCDAKDNVCVSSEWELEVLHRVNGDKSGIPRADVTSLPQFLRKKESYLKRSSDLTENIFRFSFEFSRLCPKRGEFNELLMVEYAKTAVLSRLYGLEPFITLNHFTMPKYLVRLKRDGSIDTGAWENPEVISHFRFYAENVARFLTNRDKMRAVLDQLTVGDELKDRILNTGLIKYFLTINEPAVILANCYLIGNFPPYKSLRFIKLIRVLTKLREAHRVAIATLRNDFGNQQLQLGLGHNWQYFEGFGGRMLHVLQEWCTDLFEKEEASSDFIGMHYYFRRSIPLFPTERRKRDYSEQPTFGDMFPAGIRWVMERMHAKYPMKPLFISEIGFSDRTDLRRPFWLLETVRHILEAWSKGIPVKGILHWSLVNNFEWDYGMSQKFGLFDEEELEIAPTIQPGIIRGWQAWQAAVEAIRNPISQNLIKLDSCYAAAQSQYKSVGG